MTYNSKEIAEHMKKIIDSFWRAEIDIEKAHNMISEIMSDPEKRVRIMRGNIYTSVFKNIMGKKRLEEFENLFK